MPIYWSQFDWPSFATLVTGLAAVSAAVVIGLRQTKITERQNAVAEMALKLDLYDRRFSVYTEVLNSLEVVTKLDKIGEVFYDLHKTIRSNAETSRFLFDDRVYRQLKAIDRRIWYYNYYASMHKNENITDIERQTYWRKMLSTCRKLDLWRRNLYRTFYKDLKLDLSFDSKR